MKADRFFSVHYDMRHNPKIEMLRDMGGGLVAFGRWLSLMAILYDVGGLYDFTTAVKRRYLCKELELSDDELEPFLSLCADCELLSADMLELKHVVSPGVSEQIEYYRKKSEAGKKGMAKRWEKSAETGQK